MFAPREFEWDEAKAASNYAKHRVSFPFAVRVFADPQRVDYDASRVADGEARRKVVGLIGRRLFTIVYTIRGSACRMISALAEPRRGATLCP
jgi:uncharacterized DUF497 family protein